MVLILHDGSDDGKQMFSIYVDKGAETIYMIDWDREQGEASMRVFKGKDLIMIKSDI